MKHLFIILLCFMSISCAPKITADVLMPAKSHGTSDLKSIALLPFDGNYGKKITPAVENTIVSAEVDGRQYFRVSDRQGINKIMQEQKFQMSGVVDTDTIIKLGKIMGVEGIYTGTASFKLDRSYFREERSGKNHTYNVTCTRKTAEIIFSPRLIDISSGQVVYADTIRNVAESTKCNDSQSPLATDNEIEKEALTNILHEFRRNIAPYKATVELDIMTESDGITDSKGKTMLKNGTSFAEAGRIDRACDIWVQGYETYPHSLSFIYNTGLCLEIIGDLQEAKDFYLKADRLTTKPITKITKALERINNRIDGNNKLLQQLN